MLIYQTSEWKGYGKSYYCYEYYLEGNEVVKYKCGRFKIFDGHENNWEEEKNKVDSWSIDDPNMPEWLRNYL